MTTSAMITRLLAEDKKLRIKLKSMEIAFELINNDRNRLIKLLAKYEISEEGRLSEQNSSP